MSGMRSPRALLFLVLLWASAECRAAEIIISKSNRSLEYKTADVSRKFRIGLGTAPTGRKEIQGDRRTPEGVYSITHKNPKSQFYLSLGISYPNVDDARAGLAAGLISRDEYSQIENAIGRGKLPPQNTKLGGDIFIHGRGSRSDWTWGCIALEDADMKFLFENVPVGSRVSILP